MKSGSSAPTRLSAALFLLALFALTAFSAGSASAQSAPPPAQSSPQIVDERLHGEGDRHERRAEWFFSSRRGGTSADGEMAKLRYAAFEQTREAIELQRERRAAAGFQGRSFGIWFSRGPSPSNFGNWNFGRVAGSRN